MTAREYLEQGRHLDARIDAKIQQLDRLNAMAKNATSTLTGMPSSHNCAMSKLEEIVAKIVDLQNAINADIDQLVDLKRDIRALVEAVQSSDQKTLLEKRYLCFQPWEQIAIDMQFSLHHIYKVHAAALEECARILKLDTK